MRLRQLRAVLPSCAAFVLAACGSNPTSGASVLDDPLRSVSLDRGFTARADARVIAGFAENLVLVRVIVTNEGSARSTLEFHGGCPVLMRAYRENATTPSFDGSNVVCTLPLGLMTLDPGQADTLTDAVNVSRIAPRGTTPAPYRIEALFAANIQDHPDRYVLDAGHVTIP